MKHTLLLISFIGLFGLICFSATAQVGLGIGSQGINFKTSPQKKWALLTRINFTYAGDNSYIFPELSGVRRFVNEEKAKCYAGLGLGLNQGLSDERSTLQFRLPVGVEFFPFETRRIGVSAEGGPAVQTSTSIDGLNLYFSGLIEFTFYFGNK